MNEPKKSYAPPQVVTYGPIGEHTFTNPGGHHKTGGTSYHVDNFGELVGNSDHWGEKDAPTTS